MHAPDIKKHKHFLTPAFLKYPDIKQATYLHAQIFEMLFLLYL
jgi:hypothetical protein